MGIILAVIAVVIVVAIIAVIVLRKKQSPLEEIPTTPQRTQAEATPPASPIIDKSVSPPTPAKDPLTDAQALMDEQRYDEAAKIIKRVLVADPKNTKAMFKLLQIYGLTDNQATFTQLHKKIHESGDTQVIADADELRNLLQDTAPVTQPPVTQPPIEADTKQAVEMDGVHDGLEFEFNSEPSPSDDEFSLDFDDTPEINLDDNSHQADLPSLEPINEQTVDEFSLDFDAPSSEVQNTAQTATLGDEFDALGDFDLDFDTQAQEMVNTKEDEPSSVIDADDSDAFDFDLSEHNLQIETKEDISTQAPAATSDELSFGLDNDTDDFALDSFDGDSFDTDSFDINDVGTDPTKTSAADDLQGTSISDTLDNDDALSAESIGETDEFAFDLGDDLAALTPDNDLETSQEDDSFDLNDELLFDDNTAQETTTLEAEQVADDEFLFDDLTETKEQAFDFSDINLDTSDEPSTAHSDELIALDDDEPTILDDALAIDDGMLLDESPSESDGLLSDEGAIDTQETLAPSSPLSDSLSFVDELDSTEITLSLAHEYIELGEHDSAKRLLTEVVQHGNNEQQQRAHKLLSHII